MVLEAHSNISEQFRPLVFAESRLITFIYLDDFGGVLNNVNYSYILFFGSKNITCVVMNWLHLKALPGTAKERPTTYVGPRNIHVAPLLDVLYSSSQTAKLA